MNRIVTITVVVAVILSGVMPVPRAQAGQKEWATAGKILTGVVAVGVLANACTPPPPRYEAVCPPPPPMRPCFERVHPRYGRPHRPMPPPVYYVERQVVVENVSVKETVWVVNSNGSRTPVELYRNGDGTYVGPRGEYYDGLPSNEQLRLLYGV